MYRTLLACGMLTLVVVTAGCAMCAHPYDYCYPLFTGGCDGQACTGPRAGSIRAVGGPVAAYQEVEPAQPEVYYDQSRSAPAVRQPLVQSRRMVPQANSQAQMPWHHNGGAPMRATSDVWAAIPQADRQSAQVLSVTDETLEEAQARKARTQLAGPRPTPAPSRTASRPSATVR